MFMHEQFMYQPNIFHLILDIAVLYFSLGGCIFFTHRLGHSCGLHDDQATFI